jgi:hypothetical protein
MRPPSSTSAVHVTIQRLPTIASTDPEGSGVTVLAAVLGLLCQRDLTRTVWQQHLLRQQLVAFISDDAIMDEFPHSERHAPDPGCSSFEMIIEDKRNHLSVTIGNHSRECPFTAIRSNALVRP